MKPVPGKPAPALHLETVAHGTYELSAQQPDFLTMLVFYRGFHCPACKKYLQTLTRHAADFREQGVLMAAISMDDKRRATDAMQEWALGDFPIAYGMTAELARSWGLYLSRSSKPEEPDVFSEPGLFLVRPDRTLFYAAVNSMPFGRPDLEEILERVPWFREQQYEPRGTVVAA